MRKLIFVMALLLGSCGDDDDGADTCEWNGTTYQDQEIFPAGDGCNSCQCGADGQKGQVGCTLVGCQDGGPDGG